MSIPHAAGEVVTHGINWLPWLPGDQIVTSEIEAVNNASVIVIPEEDTATIQYFTVAAGAPGETWRGVATIATQAGNVLKASIHISVKEP